MTIDTQAITLPDPMSRIADIRDRLISAAAEAGKNGEKTEIVAVSKKHAVETIERALSGGHRQFGENRVQEAMAKWRPLKERYADAELRLIGPLQSNKTGEAVALFDAIETLDRPKLARVLADEINRQGRSPQLLIQVNTGEEPQKGGVAPQGADAFIAQCANEYGLVVSGLMCIPPIDEPPAPHFALLANIAARNGLSVLSMGMSGDYETAVQFGATHVRIGTEIFGPRPD